MVRCKMYLSPFHVTSDFSATLGHATYSFFDNSPVMGCTHDGREEECRALVSDFAEWSGRNHLLLREDQRDGD